MKKSIIALAVLATMAAQADNTTLYGSVRMHYLYDDGGNGNSSSQFADNGSRIGIEGSEDLGNGLSAFYKYENRVGGGTAVTNKLYAGLKGDFGSVSAGMQNLPVDDLGNYSDPFNALTPDGRGDVYRTTGTGASKTTSRIAKVAPITSSNNSLVYTTPDMEGFSASIGVVADGNVEGNKVVSGTQCPNVSPAPAGTHTCLVSEYMGAGTGNVDSSHVDYVSANVKYEANGVFAGLGYSKANYTNEYNDAEVDTYTLGLGYGDDQFEVGLLADYYSPDEKLGFDDFGWARLSGTYKATPQDDIYLGFSSTFGVDGIKGAKGFTDEWQGAIGYQHKFSKRTRVWSEYNFADNSDQNQLSLGLRTDF